MLQCIRAAMAIGAMAMLAGPARCAAAGPFQDRGADLQVALSTVPPSDAAPAQEPQRLVAAGLALTLGTFGAHRIYLGTDAKVPIIYGLTFGGFGVLVLIDAVHILLTKDLDACRANNKVFMWAKAPKPSLTPP